MAHGAGSGIRTVREVADSTETAGGGAQESTVGPFRTRGAGGGSQGVREEARGTLLTVTCWVDEAALTAVYTFSTSYRSCLELVG